MTGNEVTERLVKWIADNTGLVAIQAYQSGQRPCNPYIVVNLLSASEVNNNESDIGYTQTEILNSEGKAEITATAILEMEWEFSVHSYGDEATSPLLRIKSIAKMPQANEPLKPDLNIHDISSVNYVPEMVNNKWEPRAHCRMYLRGTFQENIVVDVIEEFSINVSSGL